MTRENVLLECVVLGLGYGHGMALYFTGLGGGFSYHSLFLDIFICFVLTLYHTIFFPTCFLAQRALWS
jgi:hypothetical protein